MIPADINQCQSIITTTPGARDGVFQMGGPSRTTERCKNKPVVVAHETEPGEDSLVGSMSLCISCKEIFEKQMPEIKIRYEELSNEETKQMSTWKEKS